MLRSKADFFFVVSIGRSNVFTKDDGNEWTAGSAQTEFSEQYGQSINSSLLPTRARYFNTLTPLEVRYSNPDRTVVEPTRYLYKDQAGLDKR